MTRIDLEGRVMIRLDVPDDVAAKLTEDDLYEMAQAAVGASESLQAHLIVGSIAQWRVIKGEKCKILIPADVELNRCEEIGRDRQEGNHAP